MPFSYLPPTRQVLIVPIRALGSLLIIAETDNTLSVSGNS